MLIIKTIAKAYNILEKDVALIFKAGFLLGKDCSNFEVAKEITDEIDNYIYKL